MLRTSVAAVLATALLPCTTLATTYTLSEDIGTSPDKFFSSFDFFDGPDPTDGYVQYLSKDTAKSQGLVGFSPNVFATSTASDTTSAFTKQNNIYIGVSSSGISSGSTGRGSVRLESKQQYNDGGWLFVADINHMPGGVCGTWPALWLLGEGAEWPTNGELDIFEQVNMAESNAVTLHTDAGCAMTNTSGSTFTGTMITDNCDINAPDQPQNAGCSIRAPPGQNSWGKSFNAQGGGTYVAEWAPSNGGFNVWFFPRSSSTSSFTSTPPTLFSEHGKPDTSTFGKPMASFSPAGGCNFREHFKNMKIIINTTLCGQWAGRVWGSGGCAKQTGVSSCEAYVAQNPEVFKEAYWSFGGLRVYKADGVGNASGKVKRGEDGGDVGVGVGGEERDEGSDTDEATFEKRAFRLRGVSGVGGSIFSSAGSSEVLSVGRKGLKVPLVVAMVVVGFCTFKSVEFEDEIDLE